MQVVGDLIAAHRPDLVVIACNTASTLVLPPLRAASSRKSCGSSARCRRSSPPPRLRARGSISVLATPGTVARDYTRALIRDFAAGCEVELVGAPRLAEIAERRLRGEPIDIEAVRAEIAPCFVERDGRRTDKIVLACTHFPLLTDVFAELSPWPVDFVDPAPAIARRVDTLLGPPHVARRARRRARARPISPAGGRRRPACKRPCFGWASRLARKCCVLSRPEPATPAASRRPRRITERSFRCARNWSGRSPAGLSRPGLSDRNRRSRHFAARPGDHGQDPIAASDRRHPQGRPNAPLDLDGDELQLTSVQPRRRDARPLRIMSRRPTA